jgi:hypothetical protein
MRPSLTTNITNKSFPFGEDNIKDDARLLATRLCEKKHCNACENGDGCAEFLERVEEILKEWHG